MTTTQVKTFPYTNERTGRTEWLTNAEARSRAELHRQSHYTFRMRTVQA